VDGVWLLLVGAGRDRRYGKVSVLTRAPTGPWPETEDTNYDIL